MRLQNETLKEVFLVKKITDKYECKKNEHQGDRLSHTNVVIMGKHSVSLPVFVFLSLALSLPPSFLSINILPGSHLQGP